MVMAFQDVQFDAWMEQLASEYGSLVKRSRLFLVQRFWAHRTHVMYPMKPDHYCEM